MVQILRRDFLRLVGAFATTIATTSATSAFLMGDDVLANSGPSRRTVASSRVAQTAQTQLAVWDPGVLAWTTNSDNIPPNSQHLVDLGAPQVDEYNQQIILGGDLQFWRELKDVAQNDRNETLETKLARAVNFLCGGNFNKSTTVVTNQEAMTNAGYTRQEIDSVLDVLQRGGVSGWNFNIDLTTYGTTQEFIDWKLSIMEERVEPIRYDVRGIANAMHSAPTLERGEGANPSISEIIYTHGKSPWWDISEYHAPFEVIGQAGLVQVIYDLGQQAAARAAVTAVNPDLSVSYTPNQLDSTKGGVMLFFTPRTNESHYGTGDRGVRDRLNAMFIAMGQQNRTNGSVSVIGFPNQELDIVCHDVHLHGPYAASTEETGAHAPSEGDWVVNLYQPQDTEVQQNGGRYDGTGQLGAYHLQPLRLPATVPENPRPNLYAGLLSCVPYQEPAPTETVRPSPNPTATATQTPQQNSVIYLPYVEKNSLSSLCSSNQRAAPSCRH